MALCLAFKRYKCGLFLWGLYLCGCAWHPPVPSAVLRAANAAHLAKAAGWLPRTLHTASFTFKAYGPKPTPLATTLTIYIEGDGLAWISDDTPSDNPTPINPVGLKIATHDTKHPQVTYLSRPCQYVFGRDWAGCRPDDWTDSRFSAEIVQATNQAVDDQKKHYHAKKIILIGYSGGGAIAALVSASRTDVVQLITIAGTLDIDDWVHRKNLTPLRGSLNPADKWASLVSIPQIHWVGGRDTVVPKEVAFAYTRRFPSSKKPVVNVMPTFDHSCCWATNWAP